MTKAAIFIDGVPLEEVGEFCLELGPPQGKMKRLIEEAKATPPLEVTVDLSEPVYIPPDIKALLLEWMEGK
jgi:hypothetical protein